MYAGLIADVTPTPDRSIRRAEMRLVDPFEWLVLDDNGATPTYASGAAKAHIENLLSKLGEAPAAAAIGWATRMVRLDPGTFTYTPSFGAGTTLHAALRAIAVDNDGGRVYTDPQGSIFFEDRNSRTAAAFGRTSPSGTFNLTMTDVVPRRPVSDIRNKVSVAYNGGTYVVADAASRAAYGLRPLSIPANFLGAADAQTRGDEALAALKGPKDRIEVVVTSGDVAALRHILMRQISDRITLVEPNTGINTDAFIEARRIEVADSGFVRCTWQCSAV